MAETKEELQKMLDTINDIAAKYHIEFGMPKSNVMKVAGRKEAITMVPLGEQAMTQTNKYKYLGFTQTSEDNLQEENELKFEESKDNLKNEVDPPK